MNLQRILVVHRRSAYTDLVADNKESNVSRLITTGDPLVGLKQAVALCRV